MEVRFDRIFILDNPIQTYAWGSITAIPDLLGRPASGEPQAELWMGAHPKAPSRVRVNDRWESLIDVIAQAPEAILGAAVVKRFGVQLPFLFKVLAAAQPLSIQAHPDTVQARIGFEKENRLGLTIDAPQRNYRDPNHKPECICALSEFWALCGFRRVEDALKRLAAVWPAGVSPILQRFTRQPTPQGLKCFFENLLGLGAGFRKPLVKAVLEQARRLQGGDPVFDWMIRLAEAFPGDAGVFSPLLLNLLRLEKGQALFLGAGQLHAYLEGVGVELMANSDNVLRGGLTTKHIDAEELVKVAVFEPFEPHPIRPHPVRPAEAAYRTPADEFRLSVITLSPSNDYTAPRRRSVEVLLCLSGEAVISWAAAGGDLRVTPGVSLLIPAALEEYRLRGEGMFYKASVPLPDWA